jgi:hypothetical protein
MSIITVLGRLGQEDYEFKASLGYITTPYFKNVKSLQRLFNNMGKYS